MNKTSFILGLIIATACLSHVVEAQGVILNREQLAEWIPDYATQTKIDLSYKSIAYIDPHTFNELTNLTYLNLNNNQITNLTIGTFDSLANLDTLWLGANWINDLNSQLFAKLKLLSTLYLSSNRLTSVARGVFDSLVNLNYLTYYIRYCTIFLNITTHF